MSPPITDAFSSIHHRFVTEKGGTLFSFLSSVLPKLLEINWDVRANFGGVFVNGIAALSDQVLPVPAMVEYYEPKFDLRNAHTFYPSWSSDWIVYEDEFLIVAYKPFRLPTMPAKEQFQFSLRRYLDQYVGNAVHCPSRLDMSTQGLVIVSKNAACHGPLQQLFEHKKIIKKYLLLTHTVPTWENHHVSKAIGKSLEHPVLRTIDGANAKSAETNFIVHNRHDFFDSSGQLHHGVFIEANPKTGRTHQIRVHSAYLGIPIAGDKFYGKIAHTPLCLLSFSIGFNHPIEKHPMQITIPPRLVPSWAEKSVVL